MALVGEPGSAASRARLRSPPPRRSSARRARSSIRCRAIVWPVDGALVVTGCRLGDVAGRRRAFLAELWAFTGCSLAGGLAPSPAVLIVVRGLQGASAATMTPQVLSIIQARYEGERRALAIGAYSTILAVGVAAGQVLGGLLVSATLLALVVPLVFGRGLGWPDWVWPCLVATGGLAWRSSPASGG